MGARGLLMLLLRLRLRLMLDVATGTVVAITAGLTESVAPTGDTVAPMEATAAPMQDTVAPMEDTEATGPTATARGRLRLLLLLRPRLTPTMDTAAPMAWLAPMEDTVSLTEATEVMALLAPMVDTACLTEAMDTARGLLRLLPRPRLRPRPRLAAGRTGTVDGAAPMDTVALTEVTAAPTLVTAAPTLDTAAPTLDTAAPMEDTAPMDLPPPTTTREYNVSQSLSAGEIKMFNLE